MDLIDWIKRIEELATELADEAQLYPENRAMTESMLTAVAATKTLTATMRGYVTAISASPAEKGGAGGVPPQWVFSFRSVLSQLVEDAVCKIGLAQRYPMRLRSHLVTNRLYTAIVDALGDELALGDTIFND